MRYLPDLPDDFEMNGDVYNVGILKIRYMEINLNSGYVQLWELIRQLPVDQLHRLQNDLKQALDEKPSPPKSPLRELLKNGPVMSDESYKQYQELRKWMSQSRSICKCQAFPANTLA